jgi:sugar lactone lactonase YvrE
MMKIKNSFYLRVGLLTVILLLFTLMHSSKATAGGPEVWGVNASSDGLSRFDASTGQQLEFIGPLDPDPAIYTTPIAMTAVPGSGELLVWNNSNPSGILLSVDPATGLATPVDASTPVQNTIMGGIAFGPDGKLYGTGHVGDVSNPVFHQINPETGVATEIAQLPFRIKGLAFNSQGDLYGVELSTESERLVTIDPETAAVTEIGILTEDIGIIGDIVFTADGRLIGTAFNSSLPAGPYIFFDIDPATAEVTEVRASNASPPQGMALVEPLSSDTPTVEKVYWTDNNKGTVHRANPDGSGAEEIVDTLTFPRGIVVDDVGGKIYFASDAGITKANLDGSNTEVLYPGSTQPEHVALDAAAGMLYWVTDSSIVSASTDVAGAIETIQTGLARPADVELDQNSGKLYWAESSGGAIYRSSLDGSNKELLLGGLSFPSGLALDLSAGKFYFSDRIDNNIRRANLDGSGTELVATVNNVQDVELDVQEGKLYLTNRADALVQRANLDGTGIETLATALDPFGLALYSASGSTDNAPVAADDIYATNEDQPLNMGAPGVLSNDTDEGPLTAALISDVANGSLTFNTDGSFIYSPSPDYYGQDSFTYIADDGLNESNIASVIIEVAPVNDAPSFTVGPDQVVLEDSGLQAVPGWATRISAGPANESGQLLTFVVSNDNNALFAAQPAVTPDGTLLFEPAPDAYGSAEVTVQLQDDGGTVNGGLDTSSPQTAVITVLPDSDGDGVADDADNAPSDYNPDQSDLDGDGTGDVADPCPNNANDSCDPSGSASTYVDPSEEVTLSTPDGSVSITFPPGALADGSSVSITDTDSGSLFEMTTDNGEVLGIFSVDLQPSQTFNIPVRITFTWDDIDDDGFVDGAEISEEDLVIVKDGTVLTGKCREETTGDGILPDCDTDANTFTFEVDSWSQFALAGALVPEVTGITVPSAPVDINNQPISFTGAFADGDDDDAHSAQWDWGDGTTSSEGIVNQETNAVSGSHTYAEAGVYRVTLTVTDRFPNSGSLTSDYVVIYDADGGFVTGGGWIDSPAGAYVPDPAMSGKATFGFVSKYKKGATVPTGNTEFQFRAADLNFHSEAYEYLVITGEGSNYAKFKGLGAINGEGVYNFMIWAGDKDPDTFRIKIWTEDEIGAETLIYDNGFDQPIGGGSIKVQTK